MRSRDSLLFASVAAVVGGAAGFLIASMLNGGRPAQASAPLGAKPAALQPRAAAERAPEADAALRGVERTTAVAPAASAQAPVAQVPAAQLERALGSVSAPDVVEVLGGGVIRGEVQDEWGAPLQGVVVVGGQVDARRTSDPEEVGGKAPEELSLEEHLRASAKSWARTRGQTRRTLSGADGRFELAGLVEGASYSLAAYLEGHVLEAEGSAYAVSPGQRVVFRAESVHRIPVQLVFEGGGQPRDGVIGVKRGDNERLYDWSSEAPTLRLTPGRVGLRGYSGVLQAGGSRGEIDSSHASEELSLEVADQEGTPVVLALVPRTGIRGRVVDDFGVGNERQLVRLLALGADGEVDEEALARSQRFARLSGDRFHLLDLEPGPYAIGLSDWNQTLIAQRTVDVAGEVVEVELVVPEPDPSQHLIVRASGPTGRALRDLKFQWQSRTPSGGRGGGIQARRTPDGAYWLRPKAEYFAPWRQPTSYTLTIEHSELGKREIALEEGQREVEVTFVEPVTLVVVVAGYAGSNYVGKLQVSLEQVTDDKPKSGTRGRTYNSRSEDRFSPDGVARYEGLAPGRWKVDLLAKTGEWQTRSVQTLEVLALSGEQTVAMSLPVLYDLSVVAPGLEEGGYLFLVRTAGPGEEESDDNAHAQLDADHRAVFRGLAAGDYVLRGNGVLEAVEITVPCAEVYIDAKQPDCLRVAIGDTEGRMYKAGLRAGDLIVAVDGLAFGANSNLWESLIGTGEVELTVQREGKTFALNLQRMPQGSDWWATLGGMLTPASRP